MKKFNVLFVLFIALTLVSSVLAQTPEDLPAIDETAAEPWLGTWYMDQMCESGQCFEVSSFGLSASLELNADNTMIMTMGDEEPDTSYWYMKDDSAYMLSPSEDGYASMDLLIDENGILSVGDESTTMTFIRNEGIVWGTGEVAEDAVFEDFAGEWFFESIRMGEMAIPAGLFGLDVRLTIDEDGLTFVFKSDDEEAGEPELYPYELKDGRIYARMPSSVSGELEEMAIEYHIEGALSLYKPEAVSDSSEGSMVFVREENLSESPTLADLLSEFSADAE